MRERRIAPRVNKRLAVRFGHAEGSLIARTKNISASGAYCELRRYLPLMTKLQVRLDLPLKPKKVQLACEGVIVRVEPPKPSPRRRVYHIAIFFSDVTKRSRSLLTGYIEQHLAATSRRSR